MGPSCVAQRQAALDEKAAVAAESRNSSPGRKSSWKVISALVMKFKLTRTGLRRENRSYWILGTHRKRGNHCPQQGAKLE